MIRRQSRDSLQTNALLQKLMPKLVNLQALIDREIIIDTLIQNFQQGDSIVQYAMQLWFLIVKLDIELPAEEHNLAMISEDKQFKILLKANLLQLIACRMCLFYDKLLILERLVGQDSVANMFKNVLHYCYTSHLLLCWLVLY